MTYKVEISGFETEEQAEEFYHWYSGQGEQDLAIWFECQDELEVNCANACSGLSWENQTLKFTVKPEV